MTRRAEHPSGPKETICVALSPHHIEVLDRLAAERFNGNRSALITRLLDRATPKDKP